MANQQACCFFSQLNQLEW